MSSCQFNQLLNELLLYFVLEYSRSCLRDKSINKSVPLRRWHMRARRRGRWACNRLTQSSKVILLLTMISVQQKVQWVLWHAQFQSNTRTQNQFRIVYGSHCCWATATAEASLNLKRRNDAAAAAPVPASYCTCSLCYLHTLPN